MVDVQMMCGRLGMVTGWGLASVLRLHYPRWILWGACLWLITANVINISMGESAAMVTDLSAKIWILLFAGLIVRFLFWSSYRQIVRVFIDRAGDASGQTAAPPYAMRARNGAPLGWEEAENPRLQPDQFNIRNMFDSLDQAGDPWIGGYTCRSVQLKGLLLSPATVYRASLAGGTGPMGAKQWRRIPCLKLRARRRLSAAVLTCILPIVARTKRKAVSV